MRALAFPALGLALGLAPSACAPTLGDSCSLTDPCEVGVCNLSGSGDPVCVDEDSDLDGDGLPNKSDFCNEQPGGMFDEDGDGRGDDCDACPIAPPSGRADTDTDGVDSPCDPEPAMDGNRITLFEGFNTGALPPTWRKEGGMWAAQGGEARFTSMDPNAVAILTVPLSISSRHLAVQASYRVDRVDTAATQNLAGLTAIARLQIGAMPITCGGVRSGDMDSLLVDSAEGSMAKPFTNLFDPAGLYRIAQRIEGGVGACAMSANTQEGAVSANAPAETATEAGMTARGTDVRFQYLLIVQRPN